MTSPDTNSPNRRRLRSVLSLPLLLPIELYRRLVSPFIAPRCRYYPTCSSYAVQALKTYGPLRGSVLAAWRVVHCNPWSEGGIDHVEDQTLFGHRHSKECAHSHNVRDEVTA